MKRDFILRKAFLVTGITLMSFSFTSCKDSAKPEDTKEVAEEINEDQFDQADSKEDQASFFVEIAEINLIEVETANLALQKGTDSEVKKYAKMLVTDHTKSGEELKKMAADKQITLPASLTDEGKDDYEKLNDKSGDDFDKKFISMIINDHEEAIRKLERASEDNDTDPNVKSWASGKVVALKEHLQQAKIIKEKLDQK